MEWTGSPGCCHLQCITLSFNANHLQTSIQSIPSDTQGKAQLISNINACQAVADAVRTTLGPRGMDKLVADGRKVTISTDGATIMRLLEIEHPAAKTLVDISMSQVSSVVKRVVIYIQFIALFSNNINDLHLIPRMPRLEMEQHQWCSWQSKY